MSDSRYHFRVKNLRIKTIMILRSCLKENDLPIEGEHWWDHLLQENNVYGHFLDYLHHGLGPLRQVLLVEAINVPGDHGEAGWGLNGHNPGHQS